MAWRGLLAKEGAKEGVLKAEGLVGSGLMRWRGRDMEVFGSFWLRVGSESVNGRGRRLLVGEGIAT